MRIESVLAQRTRYITVALENIYQPHNASAVLRSCDAFGIQDVHIIEGTNRFRTNPGVEVGAAQWLTLRRYRHRDHTDANDNSTGNGATRMAVDSLRQAGYRIVATTPHPDDHALVDFDLLPGPVALLFGNEPDGLSSYVLEQADEYMHIPMFGFVDSFNISVSAALVLYQLTNSLRASDLDWQLGIAERAELLRNWIGKRLRDRRRPPLSD